MPPELVVMDMQKVNVHESPRIVRAPFFYVGSLCFKTRPPTWATRRLISRAYGVPRRWPTLAPRPHDRTLPSAPFTDPLELSRTRTPPATHCARSRALSWRAATPTVVYQVVELVCDAFCCLQDLFGVFYQRMVRERGVSATLIPTLPRSAVSAPLLT